MEKYLTQQTSIAPLAVFRALFGFIMLVSVIRFVANGWVYDLYIKPDYFFTFYGFDWVAPLGEFGMYALFFVMGLAALGIMLGSFYRLAAVLFFLSFTYVELIDKTNYLNHYYFVSIISFLLTLVPAHRSFSIDTIRKPSLKRETVPAWMVNIFKLQLGIVYFYAGAAKLNPDWLFNAMPLKIWLPANSHLPVIGELLNYEISAYIFSWAGTVYDLTIAFFLLYRPTRIWAYISVIVFHMLTYFLFQIGMFPFIMILSTLIFFSPEFHKNIIQKVQKLGTFFKLNQKEAGAQSSKKITLSKKTHPILAGILILHFILQLLVPLRFTLYPGNLFWTEQGYRFSWRVMLMEKAGHATFHVHNPKTGKNWQVSNWKHLSPYQEKMMATQPDMILQFAHHLEKKYKQKGMDDVEIRAESFVTLNGRRSTLLVDPDVDLTEIERGFTHKDWITPYNENQTNWFTNN
ncbi:HTTM domain-containing protein [Fodinibius halophilus]|uniref:HTTM domain-containing protein n=1 Tax=Fodinibius halophilus TaxID=1736908 RepID=A0A6M1T5A0_9BACT|nr:HTTM domain-containing protein [Fodinibius halophilus]NGP89259.1 HTTM domain-containing protein [Fodinibius halophilus]